MNRHDAASDLDSGVAVNGELGFMVVMPTHVPCAPGDPGGRSLAYQLKPGF